MSRRLRVDVPGALFHSSLMTGRGRMWHEVIVRLRRDCDLRPVEPGWKNRLHHLTPPDAWLFDGHTGPRPVRQPQVVHLLEAPWNEPETMATLEPSFIAQVVEPSRRAARAAAAIIAPSHSAKAQIVGDCGVNPDLVFVAHLGVDHDTFRPGVTGGAALVAQHGGSDAPYILSVASVHPRKNLGALRDAVALLASEGFPQQLVIVGGPAHARSDEAELYETLASDLPGAPGRVTMLPFGLSDGQLAALMAEAQAFCLPSLSEGFGLPAAEAMACATPCVLSDRGSLTEVGADAAVMVEPTPADIARGLRDVLSDPEKASHLGRAAAERAKAFDWDDCASIWFEAITYGARQR